MCADFGRNFQIREDLQRYYGYVPITDKDRREYGKIRIWQGLRKLNRQK